MSIAISSNPAALNAANYKLASTTTLNTALPRLSAGLLISPGAGGGLAAVIASQAAAQNAGVLSAAVQNTNAAVNLVQTGAGALNQISSLLAQMRVDALDAVNTNDPAALGADQAMINNASATISKITQTTAFDGAPLFSGSAAAAANPAAAAMAAFGQQSQQDLAAVANADLTTTSGPTSAVAAIDKAIADANAASGQLGAYQASTLTAQASNLNALLQNTTAANAVVQDTNFASETANYASLQTQLQSSLGSANSVSQLVTTLLAA